MKCNWVWTQGYWRGIRRPMMDAGKLCQIKVGTTGFICLRDKDHPGDHIRPVILDIKGEVSFPPLVPLRSPNV